MRVGVSRTEVNEVPITILIMLLLLETYNHIRWRVSTTALSYYLVKNGYREPSDREIKECIKAVVERMCMVKRGENL